MKKYLDLIRVKHYLKSVLIFVPLFFSGQVFNISKLKISGIGFLSFCLLSSVIYIINDLKDVQRDRIHPIKSKRPIASGAVKPIIAIIIAIIFFILSMVCNYYTENNIVYSYITILIYFIINLFYSFGAKNIPLIDLTILASGYLLRIIYGSEITNIEISNWLYITVIMGSFYMGLGKRRNEIIRHGNTYRPVLKNYNQNFLDKNMYMCMSLTIMSYSLWTIDPITNIKLNNGSLLSTVPIFMLILMKYSLNVEGISEGDPINVILKDKNLVILIIIYILILMGIIYLL